MCLIDYCHYLLKSLGPLPHTKRICLNTSKISMWLVNKFLRSRTPTRPRRRRTRSRTPAPAGRAASRPRRPARRRPRSKKWTGGEENKENHERSWAEEERESWGSRQEQVPKGCWCWLRNNSRESWNKVRKLLWKSKRSLQPFIFRRDPGAADNKCYNCNRAGH